MGRNTLENPELIRFRFREISTGRSDCENLAQSQSETTIARNREDGIWRRDQKAPTRWGILQALCWKLAGRFPTVANSRVQLT